MRDLPSETAKESLGRRMKQLQEEEEVRCPACHYVFDWEDMTSLYDHDGPCDVECLHCEAGLTVTESVRRTYEVLLKSKDS